MRLEVPDSFSDGSFALTRKIEACAQQQSEVSG